MIDPTEQFRAAILTAGLEPPDQIEADGKIHRFSSSGQRGDEAGWYLLHLDGVAAGSFGCWRAGLSSTWCAKADTEMSQAERDAHHERVRAMQAARQAEQDQRQQRAQAEALALWTVAPAAEPDHPYLTRKGVGAHGIKQGNGWLLVPMRDAAGELWNIERKRRLKRQEWAKEQAQRLSVLEVNFTAAEHFIQQLRDGLAAMGYAHDGSLMTTQKAGGKA